MDARLFRHAAAVLLLAGSVLASADQQTPFSFRPVQPSRYRTQHFVSERLATWVSAAWRHEPGRWDDAVQRVAGWTPGDLAEMLVDLDDLRAAVANTVRKSDVVSLATPKMAHEKVSVRDWYGTPGEAIALLGLTPEEAWADGLTRLVERGVILHTDIGVLAAEAASTHDVGHELSRTSLHCGFAMALVGSLARTSQGNRLILDWYRSVAGFLQLHREVASAPLFAEQAVSLFPDDLFLLMSAGSIHEMLASPTVQDRDYFTDSRLSPDIESASSHLRKAERFFRQALRLEPGQAEARVRLGRVLGGLNRHDEALAELRAVRPPDDDAFVSYFAWLFLGDEEASAGHRDLAREAYGRALGIAPTAQSGWLALSRLARRSGDRSGAIEAMRRAAELPAGGVDDRYDPWGDYNAGQGRMAPNLLRQLRKPFGRQP